MQDYKNYCVMMCDGDEKYGEVLFKLLKMSNNKMTLGEKDWISIPEDEISSIFDLTKQEFREILSFLIQRKLAVALNVEETVFETKKFISIRLNYLLVGVTGMIDDDYFEGVFFGCYFSLLYFTPSPISTLSAETIEELATLNWKNEKAIKGLYPAKFSIEKLDTSLDEGEQ